VKSLWRWGSVVALIALAAYFIVAVWRFGAFPFDDTFITLRYARNLALHGALTFNIGDSSHVDGYSSPAWTLVLAFIIRVGFDGAQAAVWLSKACGVAAGLGAFVVARVLGARRGWALLAPLACFTSVSWLVWSTPGMETPFVACCNLALLYALSRGAPADGPRLTAMLVCAIARPESAVLVGTALGLEVLSSRTLEPTARRRVLLRLGWLVAALGALFVAHWLYYGYALPNTFYVKLAGVTSWQRGRADLVTFISSHGIWLALVAAFGLLFVAGAPRKIAVLTLIAFAATAYAYGRAGGDYIDYHRYYQPAVPSLFALLAVAASRLSERSKPLTIGVAIAGLGVAAALVVDGEQHLRTAWRSQTLSAAAFYARAWRTAGEALARAYPATTVIAVRPAGLIPYVTDFPTLDVLGLNDHDIALHAEILRAYDPGHNKEASPRQIVARHPDVIVNHPTFSATDQSGHPHPQTPAVISNAYTWKCIPAGHSGWLCVFEKR